MRRKRQAFPEKIDEAKRRSLSWSPPTPLDFTVEKDDDPADAREIVEIVTRRQPLTNGHLKKKKVTGESDLDITLDVANSSRDTERACVGKVTVLEEFSFQYSAALASPNTVILTWNVEDESLALRIPVDDKDPIDSKGRKFSFHGFQALQSLHHGGVVTLTGRHMSNGYMSSDFVVELGFTEEAFSPLTNPSDLGRRSPFGKRLKQLLEELRADSVTKKVKESQPLLPDIDSLYVAIRDEQKRQGFVDEADPSYMPHSALLPNLRRYQKKAVAWMIQREMSSCEETDEIHELWHEVKTSHGSSLYYNQFSENLTRKKFVRQPLPPGGILADEMGLGKTVEVLACILANQMPKNRLVPTKTECNGLVDAELDNSRVHCVCGCKAVAPSSQGSWILCQECQCWQHLSCVGFTPESDELFICARCWSQKDPIECKTTLIISPASIAQQWIEEIKKHVKPGSLSYMVYNGVAGQGFMNPLKLSEYDIVVMTYKTLKQELNHADEGGRSMRYQKKYVPMPSPLLALKFWRICLDEAQMVESTTTKAAEMASRLVAVHSWCVTGTPVQKSLKDLYGLLVFLHASPYSQKAWWERLLFWPYVTCGDVSPLVNLLSQIFWRNAKSDVSDELQLPTHTEETKWLIFSSVEAFFYQRQQESCLQEANKVFAKCHREMDTSLGSLDRREVHKMMKPLLRLRQACCHPQLVRGKFITMSLQRSSVTMEELLDRLILKTKTNCVESHRQIIFALNGLAGIHALKEEIVEAIEKYREAVSSWEEYAEFVKTDHSQKIHTLYNLSSLLKTNPVGCGRTLQDDSLDEKIADLKEEYQVLVTARVKSATDKLESVRSLVQESHSNLDSTNPWWLLSLHMAKDERFGDSLVSEVKGMLTEAMMTGRVRQMTTIAYRFHDSRGLALVVHLALEEMQSKRDKAVAAVDQLMKKLPTQTEIQMAAACHLRNTAVQSVVMEKCAGCQADSLLSDYEQILFAIREQTFSRQADDDLFPEEAFDDPSAAIVDGQSSHNKVTWGDSEVERILKHIASSIKSFNPSAELVTQSQTHLSLLDNMKKEFRALRGLWLVLDQQMAALDELEMATSRLRFRQPGEPVSHIPDTSVIDVCEVDAHRFKFQSDLHVGREELRKHLGQLKYLHTLEKKQEELTEENTSPCPICATALGVEWAVLTCGHCVCCTCSCFMVDRARIHRTSITCPLCRFVTQPAELTYVSVNCRKQDFLENRVAVKGSHSTKVEAVIDCVLRIGSEDPYAKVLIFSTWVTVLDILARSMDQNNITYRLVNSGKMFHKSLTEFKQNRDVTVCLMPLHSGSKGLNIVEATYVLLVEPSLNPANDQQAVGRVYRIGQTKPTRVYRFYVDHTVESRIYELLQHKSLSNGPSVSSRQSQTEAEQLTVADLSGLFKDTSASAAENHSGYVDVD